VGTLGEKARREERKNKKKKSIRRKKRKAKRKIENYKMKSGLREWLLNRRCRKGHSTMQ